MSFLANIDTGTAVWIGLSAFNMVVEIAMAFILFGLNRKTEEVAHLKEEVKSAGRELIQKELSGLQTTVEDIKRRLSNGDNAFDKIRQRDQETELEIVTKLADFKDWMREQFASRQEVKSIGDRQQQMEISLATIAANCPTCGEGQ